MKMFNITEKFQCHESLHNNHFCVRMVFYKSLFHLININLLSEVKYSQVKASLMEEQQIGLELVFEPETISCKMLINVYLYY